MAKKKKAKATKSFAWSPVRKLMKECGATIVARDAVDLLIANLEEVAGELTEKCLKFASHANRKKITKDDMLLAIKYI